MGLGAGSHLNLFIRYAKGLAAFDELASASSVNRDRRAVDAQEGRIALSGNFQTEKLSLMVGGYARYFVDGDINTEDFDDRQGSLIGDTTDAEIGRIHASPRSVRAGLKTKWSKPTNGRTIHRPCDSISSDPSDYTCAEPGA